MDKFEKRHEMQQMGYTREEIDTKLTRDDWLAGIALVAFLGLLVIFWNITP